MTLVSSCNTYVAPDDGKVAQITMEENAIHFLREISLVVSGFK